LRSYKLFSSKVPSVYFGSKPPLARKTFLQTRLWKSHSIKVFAANIAIQQEVIVADIMMALFIFARFWCTPTHV